jgi:hypothetical protein
MNFIIFIGETYFWAMIQQPQPTLPLFKPPRLLVMAISYSVFLLALPTLLLSSYGVSIASIKRQTIWVSPLYLQVASKTSILMAAKTDKIISECFSQAMVLSSGLSNTLEPIKAKLIASHEDFLMNKKSLSLSIQV